jgi:Uma2 family endonuclease
MQMNRVDLPFWPLDPRNLSLPVFPMIAAAEGTILETWATLCEDPRFQGIPYKIETDECGRILKSPTKNYHGFFASRINRLLDQFMAGGTTGNEIGVVTTSGVKVPDSVWASEARFRTIFGENASSIAPEICVEILSAANTATEFAEKRDLYFRAGAKEVWMCDPEGAVRFFAPKGELRRSNLCPKFPKNIGVKWEC